MHVFRIRPPVSDHQMSTEEFERRRRQYETFLASHRPQMPKDLWSFFAWDVFHDGELERITWARSLDVLRLKLTCPNVKRVNASGDFEFVNVSFLCTFHGVCHFEVHRGVEPLGTFMGSEIDAEDSLLQQTRVAANRNRHSLLIEFEAATMLVLFEDLSVAAAEPVGFELMRNDPAYVIPTAP